MRKACTYVKKSKLFFKDALMLLLVLLHVVGCSKGTGAGNEDIANQTFGLKLTIIDGDNQTAAPGRLFIKPLVVQVTNVLGDPVSGVNVIFSVESGAGFHITPTVVKTSPSGFAAIEAKGPDLYNIKAKILAQVENTSVTGKFNLATNYNNPSLHFEISTTYGNEVTAGKAFGFIVKLINAEGNIEDVNETLVTRWTINTKNSWGGQTPANASFSTLACVFEHGVCLTPENIILRDSREPTIVFMGDGDNVGYVDVFEYNIKVKSDVISKMLITKGIGGPSGGATALLDALLTADTAPLLLGTALTDSSGNYISDGGTVTWNSINSDNTSQLNIANYLTPKTGSTTTFTPTKTVPHPNYAFITADSPLYPQAKSGKITVDPGTLFRLRLSTSDGSLIRTAGESFGLHVEALDKDNNLIGNNFNGAGFDGQMTLRFTTTQFSNGHAPTAGSMPWFGLSNSKQDELSIGVTCASPPCFYPGNFGFKFNNYTENFHFSLGKTSSLASFYSLFFFEANTDPIITVTNTATDEFPQVSDSIQLHINSGPAHHLGVRDALGANSKSLCMGGFGSGTNLDSPQGIGFKNVKSIITADNGTSCPGLKFTAGDAATYINYAVEDIAGNFIDNINVNVDLNKTVSNFAIYLNPKINTNQMSFASIKAVKGNLYVNASSPPNYKSVFGYDVTSGPFDHYNLTVYEGSMQSIVVNNHYLKAGKEFLYQITPVDAYGNNMSFQNGWSDFYSFGIQTITSGSLINGANNAAPKLPPANIEAREFLWNDILKTYIYNTGGIMIPNVATGTVTFQVVTNGSAGIRTPPRTYTMIPGDVAAIDLRASLNGPSIKDAPLSMSVGEFTNLYLVGFDQGGNQVPGVLGKWEAVNPLPSDCMGYNLDPASSNTLIPIKPCIMEKVYIKVTEGVTAGTLVVSTGTVQIFAGDFHHLHLELSQATIVAGGTIDVIARVHDSKHNLLVNDGTFALDIEANGGPFTYYGYGPSAPNKPYYQFTQGVSETLPFVFYNAETQPQIIIRGFFNSVYERSGNTNIGDIKILASTLGSLSVAPAFYPHKANAGASTKFEIGARDKYGNLITTGSDSTLQVQFSLTNGTLNGAQDITNTTILTGVSPSNLSGPGHLTVTGSLVAGLGEVYVSSTKTGLMKASVTTTNNTPVVTSASHEGALIIEPLPTVAGLRWNPAPPSTYPVSLTAAIGAFGAEAHDTYGNTITTMQPSDNVVIETLLTQGSNIYFSGTKEKTMDAGLAIFDDLKYIKAGLPIVFKTQIKDTVDPAKILTGTIAITPGTELRSIVVMPNQLFTQGVTSATAAITGNPFFGGSSITSATSFQVTAYLVDEAFNVSTTYGNSTFIKTLGDSDPFVNTAATSLVGGSANFWVSARKQGTHQLIADVAGFANPIPGTAYQVTPTTASKLIAILPGQTLAEGAPNAVAAASGTNSTITAGSPFSVNLYSVDDQFNKVPTTGTVGISAVNDAYAINPSPTTLTNGTAQLMMTNKTAGASKSVSPSGAGLSAVNSSAYTVSAGAATKCLALYPEQTPVPGNGTVTGAVSSKSACGTFNLRVLAVDNYYNIDSSNNSNFDLTNSDLGASGPGSLNFSNGTYNLAYVPATVGTHTFTLSCDLTTVTPSPLPVTLGTARILTPYFSSLQSFDSSHGYSDGVNAAIPPAGSIYRNAGTSYPITVVATDQCYNKITTATGNVTLTTTGSNFFISTATTQALSAGSASFAITHYKAMTGRNISSSDTSNFTNATTANFDIVAGASARLVAVMPGETFIAGQANQAAAAAGTPSKQTAGDAGTNYPYSIKIYATDDYFNLASDSSSQITLNPSNNLTYITGATLSLTSGTAEFVVYNDISGGTLASFTVTPLVASGTATYSNTQASEGFQVLGSLTTPTAFTLEDPVTLSTTYLRSTQVRLSYTGSANATSWCVRDGNASKPSTGTNGKISCGTNILTGGTTWYSGANPSIGTISATAGTHNLYLWVADAANNVYAGTISSSIILDSTAPSAPAFTLISPSFLKTTTATINITSDTVDAKAWCFLEVPAPSPAPTAPSFNSCSGPDGWRGPNAPTTVTSSGNLGARKFYLYAKDIAENISVASGAIAFTFDNIAPGSFTIAGLQGPTGDTFSDSWLGTTTVPTVVWNSAVESTTDVNYTIDISSGSLLCSDIYTHTQGDGASGGSQPLSKIISGCNLAQGGTYSVSINATDQAGNSVNSSNNNYNFTVDNSYSSGGTFAIRGAHSIDGNDSTDDEYLKAGSEVRAVWTASTISDGLSSFAYYAVSIVDHLDAVVCPEVQVASISTNYYDFNGCGLENGKTYKIKVAAFDQAGNFETANGSPFMFTVSTDVNHYGMTLLTTGTLKAGETFQVKLEALKPDSSLDTNYSTSPTINYTTNANNGSITCDSGVTLTPEYSGVTFSAGTAILNVTLKKAESGVYIVANGPNSTTGTLSGLNLYPNSSYCNKITNANSSPTLMAGTTPTLAPEDSLSLGLGAFDHWGNYIGLTSGTWTGTNQLVGAPTPSVGSITTITATDAGSGSIQVGGSSDSVNFTLTTGTINFSSSSQDLDPKYLLSTGSYTHMAFYDTTKDFANLWITVGTQSWYNETPSATRGSRKEFPLRAIIVSTAQSVDIIDDTNHRLFMRFEMGPGKALDTTFGNSIEDIKALEGKVYISVRDTGTDLGAVFILDFKNDEIHRISNSSAQFSGGNVFKDRNSSQSWGVSSYPNLDANESIYRLAVRRISGEDYLALGTSSRAYVIRTSTNKNIDKYIGSQAIKNIELTSAGILYFSEENLGLNRASISSTITDTSNGTFTIDYTYNKTTSAEIPNLSLSSISIAENTLNTYSDNTLLVGSSRGLSVIKENPPLISSATSIHYTYQGTDTYKTFSNSVILFDSSSSYATAVGSGTIDQTLTLEFWFRPDADLNLSTSPSKTLLLKGNTNVNGSYGIEINKNANGKLAFWLNHNSNSTIYQVESNTTSWVKGEWHHIAAVITTGTMKLFMDKAFIGGAAIPAGFNANDNDALLIGGDNNGHGFTGAIDELRISKIVQSTYSGSANYSMPTGYSPNSNTVYYYDFNNASGSTATAGYGPNATLNNAWFASLLFNGDNHNIIKALADKPDGNSTSISAEVITSTSWNELSNMQSSTPALLNSNSTRAYSDILYCHRNNYTSKDIFTINPETNTLILQLR